MLIIRKINKRKIAVEQKPGVIVSVLVERRTRFKNVNNKYFIIF